MGVRGISGTHSSLLGGVWQLRNPQLIACWKGELLCPGLGLRGAGVAWLSPSEDRLLCELASVPQGAPSGWRVGMCCLRGSMLKEACPRQLGGASCGCGSGVSISALSLCALWSASWDGVVAQHLCSQLNTSDCPLGWRGSRFVPRG